MSYQIEVKTTHRGVTGWTGNAVRFATLEEADAYGVDLLFRWTTPSDYRVVDSTDPVNYRFDGGILSAVHQPSRALPAEEAR